VDIVLLDINMPEVGGVEACQHLRSLAPRSGIVMLTVRDAEDDKVQALDAGADALHHKAIPAPRADRAHGRRFTPDRRRRLANAGASSRPVRVGDGTSGSAEGRQRNSSHSQRIRLARFPDATQDVPVTHAKLLRAVWGPEYGNEPDYLRSYVKTLRKKIENILASPSTL